MLRARRLRRRRVGTSTWNSGAVRCDYPFVGPDQSVLGVKELSVARTGAGRVVSIFGLTVGLVLLGAGVASAHVTVAAPGVTVGASDAAITFRVPDESASASTVGFKVQLPTAHPIAGVLVAPLPGWTAKIITMKLAAPIKTDDGEITEVVSEVDWTADANSDIKPGFFGEFTIIGGKLPDGESTLTFKAVQTYSDKSVVAWIEVAAPGSATEPEHPAPVLKLAAAAPDTPAGTSSAPESSTAPESLTSVTATGSSPAVTASASSATDPAVSVVAAPAASAGNDGASEGSVTWALVIGALGAVLGASGVTLALAVRRRSSAR